MDARTIDTGATIADLRQFGPPEVIELDDFAGNALATEHVSLFWELVGSVSFLLTCGAGGTPRTPRLRFFAGDATPFAEVVAPFTLAATLASRFTFCRDIQPAGANNAAAIVTVLPLFTLLPGWSLEVDVLGGLAGDAASEVRVYRERFTVVELELAENRIDT